jgi:starch phosphorylase
MEYGIEPSFNIYAGGLGILAGDIVKTAKDMNLPMVFIGILWRQGYSIQKVDENCQVSDITAPIDDSFTQFVTDTNVTVNVSVAGRNVLVKIWKHKVYNLYLLDTYLSENGDLKTITASLYGSGNSMRKGDFERIAQEIILGIGGVYALEALNISVDLYHFNEGHPVFAALHLVRRAMWSGVSFEAALNQVRNKIVFTTHTPIKAGNETHDLDLICSLITDPHFTKSQLEQIGGNPFDMTLAALRFSHLANAVSVLHTKTANEMWCEKDNICKIIPVTNGVHVDTWQSRNISETFQPGGNIYNLYYESHAYNKKQLVDTIASSTGTVFDPNSLIIGFARRATSYKRWGLIFNDSKRFEKLIAKWNIQFVFSGKSHANDTIGKESITLVNQMAKKYARNIVFLQGYNMSLSKIIVSGCDVWLNTPIRPMEACGTSGIKAALNGALNVSILDGWWDEGYNPADKNGWAIGDRNTRDNVDSFDANSLYDVLENEVLPTYYNKDKWQNMMINSILTAKYKFSSERMLSDYVNYLYNF